MNLFAMLALDIGHIFIVVLNMFMTLAFVCLF